MNRTRHVRLVLPVAILLASVVPTSRARANPPPVWSYQADCPIRWYLPTPTAVLLVGTEREIIGIAPDSGTVTWRLGPIKNSNAGDIELLSNSADAILSVEDQASGLSPLSLIDLRDGRALWTSATLGVLQSIGSFLIPGTDNLLLRAKLSARGDNTTAMLLDLASGAPIWTNRTLGRPRFPYMYKSTLVYPRYSVFMDTDTTMIVAMWDALFLKFNLRTGENVWEATGNRPEEPTKDVPLGDAIKALGSIIGAGKHTSAKEEEKKPPEVHEIEFAYAPILQSEDGGRFYAPYKGTVAPFSMLSGECLWSNPPMLMGLAAQTAELPAGLLVRVVDPSGNDPEHRVVLLDKETGAVKWKWPKSYWTAASNFIVESDRVVIAADGKIRAADLAEGKEQTLADLRFEDIDDANSLLVAPDGYVAIGRSNLGIYAKEGGQRTKKYFRPPPDDEGWGLALLGLSALTFSARTIDLGSGVKVSGGLDPMLGLNKLLKDYSASRESERYAYFLADAKFGDEEGTGIVRVKRETGDVAGEVLLGKKKPDYAVDLEGRLYFRPDSKTIRCYRF